MLCTSLILVIPHTFSVSLSPMLALSPNMKKALYLKSGAKFNPIESFGLEITYFLKFIESLKLANLRNPVLYGNRVGYL